MYNRCSEEIFHRACDVMGQTIMVLEDAEERVWVVFTPTSLMNECIEMSEEGA